MFSGRKDDKAKRPRRSGGLAQLGLMDVPGMDNFHDDEDHADLEAELAALTGGGGGNKQLKKGKPAVSPDDLAKMVAECMQDDYDNDQLNDEDDPELLAELSALSATDDDDGSIPPAPIRPAPTIPNCPSPVSDYRNPEPRAPRNAPMAGGNSIVTLLAERISLYEQAEANAKASGETSRARRFNRGLKTLIQMQKAVKAGHPIEEDEIPPAVVVKLSGGSKGGSADTTSTSSPAALSPSEERPGPVTTHSNPLGPPASIPHEVVFQDTGKPRPQPPPRSSLEKWDLPSRPPIEQSNSLSGEPLQRNSSSGPPLQQITSSSDPASIVRNRHSEYKMAALSSKKSGNKEQAIQFMRIMKQMEPMLRAAENDQAVDLTTLPGPPGTPTARQPKPEMNTCGALSATNEPMRIIRGAMVPPSESPSSTAVESVDPLGNTDPATGEPPSPSAVLEALEQRLAKYVEQRDKAKKEENARKERMNQRIMKQYEDAIKKHKVGKPVDFDELPTPPGFLPIPVGASKPPAAPAAESIQGDKAVPKQPRAAAPQAPPAAPKPAPTTNVRQAPQSRVEKQLAFLTKRQTQFKQAALEAKKRGEIEQAKEYLRMCKGFDQLIEATRGGLPVDMNTVPVPPQEQIPHGGTDFELVSAEDCVIAPPNTSVDVTIMYAKLEEDLVAQIKMCAQTREHFKATGDVTSSNRFEQLILHTKKDLDAVRAAFKRGCTPPRFHYENRSFNIIQCNTDLNDSDCEISIVRGINFNVQNPSDVDTYVKIEFPYPTDNPPQDRSYVVKDTNNPEYDHKIVFSIDRKSRALARVFKRHAVKVQVYAKGGWFHRDTVLGVVKVPLVTLETKCTLHESYDLADERKRIVGGKLEVKIRVRNPIVTKQLEKVTEKWLVIDGF
ncbi:coiled-coil and C2 domain-containing protein 1-like [Homarus americanus]|uniref:coiled-coil and C2 domain-containing protein 1-like n=1 Tax=Homarus americanus TaxID=6706 RepID=UPI001C47E7A1|nr:coiled-coil and C2 domain-containing protein 1-like [Homarus americanus]